MSELKDKAIKIKGKDYVLVKDRVLAFHELYPNGSIETEQLSTQNPKQVKFRAVVVPDCTKPERRFTGHSQAIEGDGYINQVAALENAETSAVGRALAMLGIGVIDSIASADEMNKAQVATKLVAQEKEVLTNEKFEKMIEAIEAGRGDEVRARLPRYTISEDFQAELDAAFSNYELNLAFTKQTNEKDN